MKKISLLLSMMILVLMTIVAQDVPAPPPIPSEPPIAPEDWKDGDTTRFKLGDKEFLIIGKNKDTNAPKSDEDMDDDEDDMDDDDDKDDMENGDKHHENTTPHSGHKKSKSVKVGFLELDLGLNFLRNDGAPANTFSDLKLDNWKSWNVTFNFLPTEIYLGTKKALIMTSFGWRISEHQFKNNIEFTPNKSLEYLPDSTIKKSQLVSHYLQIPVMFYFQTKKFHSIGRLGLGIGAYGGILVHQESEVRKVEFKREIETEEDFGFSPYRYGLTARVDLGYINLFANYDLNDTWEDSQIKNVECGLWFNF